MPPPLPLPPQCFLLDPPMPLQLGVDYEWDAETNAIRRLPDGSIPDGGEVAVQQQIALESALIEHLAAGEVVPIPMPRLRVQAVADWEADPDVTEWSDLAWLASGELSLSSRSSRARLAGPPALLDAYEALLGSDPLVRIAAELAPGFVLPLFEGFVLSKETEAIGDGRIAQLLQLTDPLVRLMPPYVRLESRRWGREIVVVRTIQAQVEVAGFTIRDVIETRVESELPMAHRICRDIFESLDDPWFEELSLGFLDFPVVEFDGRDRAPLQLLTDIARLAGARVEAIGRLLVIHEVGPASRTGALTCLYDIATLSQWEQGTRPSDVVTAVQLYGHAETGLVATRPQFPIGQDPSQPGYVRLGETDGVLEPQEPLQSAEPPAPLLLTFTFNATLYDPATLIVEGGRRIGQPRYVQEVAIRWATIDLEIPWVVTDAGEAPFTLDENGDPRFVIAGQIIDALASMDGDPQPVPYATVTIIRLIGDEPGEESETMLTDEQGFYRFTDVALGRWRVEAEAPGYRPNWEDSDPENNLVRDLEAEYAEWLTDGVDGRYRKEPTAYHVIVWGKAYAVDAGIQDLTLGQVRVEVRAMDVDEDDLHYAPAIRDEHLTTERLAIRVGQILLWSAQEVVNDASLVAPFTPLVLPGDRLVIRDGETSTAFRVGHHRWIIDSDRSIAESRFAALDATLAGQLVPAVVNDPLGTRVGTVVAVHRNVAGQEIADVEVEGQVLTGLGASPLVGRVEVGETVQIARWFPGATALVIVARSPMRFGAWRVVEVEVD